MTEDNKPKPYFDAEKQEQAAKWINEKCGDLECECCKTKNWSIPTEIVAPPVFRDGLMLGGALAPAFNLICMNCGNTKFFNAIISKIVKVPEQAKPESPAEKAEGENG